MRLVLLLTLICNLTLGQADNGTKYYFGFNLMPNFSGQLITYAIVHVKDGKVIGSTPYNKDKWCRLVAGVEMSPANKKLENLFKKNQVDSCWVLYDAHYYKYGKEVYVGMDCWVLNDLWKLRYKKHPYEYNKEGWSMDHYNPNGNQWAFLRRFYGVSHQSQFFYGENMWKLFRDMNDPDWPAFYQDGDLTWESIEIEEGDDEEDKEDDDDSNDDPGQEDEKEETEDE